MKRTTKVRVKFEGGTVAEATVSTTGVDLLRHEAQSQHDEAVDRVVGAIRTLPYAGDAPLRAVKIH